VSRSCRDSLRGERPLNDSISGWVSMTPPFLWRFRPDLRQDRTAPQCHGRAWKGVRPGNHAFFSGRVLPRARVLRAPATVASRARPLFAICRLGWHVVTIRPIRRRINSIDRDTCCDGRFSAAAAQQSGSCLELRLGRRNHGPADGFTTSAAIHSRHAARSPSACRFQFDQSCQTDDDW